MNDEELRAVADEWVAAKGELDKLERTVGELADLLREHLAIGSTVTTGDGIKVGLRPGARRFDEAKARALLTQDQLDSITEHREVLSKTAADMYLPGALVEALCTRTRPTLVMM